MSFFNVLGQRFPFPLSLRRLIYYERKRILSVRRDWASRCWRSVFRVKGQARFRPRPKDVFKPLPVYKAALDYARSRNNLLTLQELRQSSPQDSDVLPYQRFQTLCSDEERAFEAREKIQSQRFTQQLKKQKYG